METASHSSLVNVQWPPELKPIIVITMGDVARIRRISSVLREIEEFVLVLPAVPGHALDLAEMQSKGKYKPIDKWNELTNGQVACFMSHQLAWKYILKHKVKSALILEDDATSDFSEEKLQSLARVISRLRDATHQWNILYLGRNSQMMTNKKRFTADIVAPGRSWGLFAYAVSEEGAQHLLKKSRVIQEAVDIFVSTTPLQGRFAITPNFFEVYDDGVSETQHRRVHVSRQNSTNQLKQTNNFGWN